ncbi:MAG TPA: hypothetical protein VJ063_15745 [Verrucomicrobiae bacterium]|nr:hypothetical protein [Verrucomicrobiae bacterium]
MMPPEYTEYILIGAVALALVLAFVGVAWLWKRFQPQSKPQQSATPPPCRITLVSEDNPRWKAEKYVGRCIEHFRALGFQRIGAYRIPELDSQHILALFHPAQKFYACVYDNKTHPTFEIFAAFASDNSMVGTNSVWVRDIEQRPGSIIVRIGNATPAQIMEALRQHEKAGDRIAVTADQFAPTFLKAYIQNFNWRLKKCEISRDQIRMDARQEGRVVTNEQVEELYRLKRAAYVAQLQDACRAQYRDENKLNRGDWEELQNRLVAIPETYDLKEVINACSYAAPAALNEKQMFTLQRLETSLGDDGIVLVNRIITKNIAELNLRQIGEVKEPVRAWIVVAEDAPPAAAAVDPLPAPVETAKAAA